jgi:hypothetical protein
VPDLSPDEDEAGTGVAGLATSSVTAALARLEDLEHREVHEHVEAYDEVHRSLQDALASLDEA